MINIKNNNQNKIEKEINYFRRKVARFKIWKEKFMNIKEVFEVLHFDDTKYDIQLKKENYSIKKFKIKWELIAEVKI
jgi:hypothetical protein